MPRFASDPADRRIDPRGRIEPISMRILDACRFTGISRSTLYILIARGEIETTKLGSSTLVLTESLQQLFQGRRRRDK